jgi:glycosyltransferase involved in cell wall biosynthesis
MDVFVFRSTTDTFGNVVLEALSSGVPAVVSDGGGPKFLVTQGITGYIARTVDDYADAILKLRNKPELLDSMRLHAREASAAYSWSAVFDHVYDGYRELSADREARSESTQNLRAQPSPAP